MKNFTLTLIVLFTFTQCTGLKQNTTKNYINSNTANFKIKRPKLIVGIVVDQMRYDYLTRFYNKYSNNGFKKLINNGFNCLNTHFNYIPTYTAVGHASIYTGTTPSIHGIIGNDWYDKFLKKDIYCVDDDNYKTIGTKKGGKKSPNRLQTTTITDQLNLHQYKKGKVIGISLKDRSAILPVGQTANAAYWFRGKKDGKFITSSYYMDSLPKWVTNFNDLEKPKELLNSTWNTLLPISSYTESIKDNNKFEGLFTGETTPTFPHDLPNLKNKNNNYSILKATPFGNTLVNKFAQAAIIGENLGKSNITDFLAISFSSTDYIGHKYGTDSKEIEDTYIRLDLEIAELLNFLEKNIGTNNYTIFFTADHAAVPVPSYLQSLNINAGYFDYNKTKSKLNEFIFNKYHTENLIENITNFQIFLNHDEINKLNLDLSKVSETIANEIINYENIYKTATAKTMQTTQFSSGILSYLQNGYNQKLSGDVLIIPTPATVYYNKTGTTHGSGFNYDTHVPLIFYGYGINKGQTKKYTPIINIAPTISSLLNIEFPNGNTGNIITEALK